MRHFLLPALLLLLGTPTWAQSISEETPPISCGHSLLTGLTCSGKYCDDLTPLCGRSRYEIYDIRWTDFVSEEGDSEATCRVPNPFDRGDRGRGETAFITGLSCQDDYCDKIALECVALRDAFPASYGGRECRWTIWVSEETPTLRFPRGYGAIAMACRGKYCDDKSFHICPIQDRRRRR